MIIGFSLWLSIVVLPALKRSNSNPKTRWLKGLSFSIITILTEQRNRMAGVNERECSSGNQSFESYELIFRKSPGSEQTDGGAQ